MKVIYKILRLMENAKENKDIWEIPEWLKNISDIKFKKVGI